MEIPLIIVKRLNSSYSNETVSEIYIDDKFYCYGIEQPYKDNKPFESCIPYGSYNLVKFKSSKHGNTFAFNNPLLGVTPYKSNNKYLGYNRYACLIHSANFASELKGCLALGERLIDKKDCHMVTNSRKTVTNFKKMLWGYIKENDITPDEIEVKFVKEDYDD